MTDLPPKRLLDDPTVAAELRQDLRAERERPVDYDAAAGLAAFSATLGAAGVAGKAAVAKASAAKAASGVGGGVGGTVGAKLGMAALAKGAATLLVVGGLGVAGYQVAQRSPSDPPAAPRSTAPQVTAPAVAPIEPPPAPGVQPEEPSAELPVQTAPERDPLQAEIAMLARIKRNLDARPAVAYRLSQQAQTRFGEGMLYQEREGLAVLALVKLGRMAEAQARGRRFLSRFPNSPLSQRVQAALASPRMGVEE